MIFVEYPINVFENYSCAPLSINLMMYDDNNIPILLNHFDSQYFRTRPYDQTCYFRLDKAMPYIKNELLQNKMSVYKLSRLEYRARIFVQLSGLVPGAVYYR